MDDHFLVFVFHFILSALEAVLDFLGACLLSMPPVLFLLQKWQHSRRTESQLAKRLRELAAKDEELRQARQDLELEKNRVSWSVSF